MLIPKNCNWLLLAICGFAFTGCGGASTTINEKTPIISEEDEHDHEHEHQDGGRLVISNATGAEALIYNLEDNSLINAFELVSVPSALYASAGYRYGILVDRAGNTVNFLDGGLWQEDHVDHLHDYNEAPALLNYTLTGSRPTHFVIHENQLAVFYDGDATSSTPASVTVVTDADIAAGVAVPRSIDFSVNMHGVAEPRADYLLASWRRADAETTSANPILPDQVAVYHLHDGQYQQETILGTACPDLHGAAQNENHIVFGCSDGVLLVSEQEGSFTAQKILNTDAVLDGLRIGSIYGHENSDQFIALASAHGGTSVQWFSINPALAQMELIDWQPVDNAKVVSRGFSFEAEQFLILDNQGYVTVLEPSQTDGVTQWVFAERLDITEQDIASMPEGTNFSLTFSQNDHFAYVADPIAQQVVIIDLNLLDINTAIELDYVPKSITWLGIAGAHEH